MRTDQASHRLFLRAGDRRLTDFGELPFREGIDVLLWSLEHESGNPPERVTQVAANLVLPGPGQAAAAGRRPQALPEIAAQEVTGADRHHRPAAHRLDPPAGAAGHPAGCALAARVGDAAAVPAAGGGDAPRTDPRIAEVQRAIEPGSGAAQLQAIHPYGARRPEQCLGLIDWGFVNQTYLAYQRIPTYYEWYLNADQRLVYEHHKRFLQHLQCAQSGRVGAQVAQAPVRPGRAARGLPRRPHRLDPPRPGQGHPVKRELRRHAARHEQPGVRPAAVRRRVDRPGGDGAAPRPVRP